MLEYVEENGVKSCGGVVVATPQALLYLLDAGVAFQVDIWDAWLDID